MIASVNPPVFFYRKACWWRMAFAGVLGDRAQAEARNDLRLLREFIKIEDVINPRIEKAMARRERRRT